MEVWVLRKRLFLIFLPCVLIIFSYRCESTIASDDWALTLYGAQLSADSLGDTLLCHADYEDSYLLALALSKRIISFREYLDTEIEGQAVKHFGDQDNWEFNGLVVIRWLPFPWDVYLDTSFAVGAGLSYALKTPAVEGVSTPNTPRLLGYLLFELTFSSTKAPNWSFVARIHHRSGANGLFNGRLDASNAFGLGLRYAF